ncbi:unnamed protein product [Pedinophyceae sp. YPF-701]|nr:unnamed protein product [Pedinophyceae sp. YPF-701]
MDCLSSGSRRHAPPTQRPPRRPSTALDGRLDGSHIGACASPTSAGITPPAVGGGSSRSRVLEAVAPAPARRVRRHPLERRRVLLDAAVRIVQQCPETPPLLTWLVLRPPVEVARGAVVVRRVPVVLRRAPFLRTRGMQPSTPRVLHLMPHPPSPVPTVALTPPIHAGPVPPAPRRVSEPPPERP